MRRNVVLGLTLIAVAAGGIAAAAAARTVYLPICPLAFATTSNSGCPPRTTFGADIKPKTLPKHEMAPIALGVSMRLAGEGSPGTGFEEVQMSFDRNSSIDAHGLLACGRNQIASRGRKAARRECRKSIVGGGVAHIAIDSSPGDRVPVPLTLFNGGFRRGMTTILVHGVIPVPRPKPLVAAIRVRKTDIGRYGWRALARIPPIANGAGSLLDLSFEIHRLYSNDGARNSYLGARCLDQHLNAALVAVFDDGTRFLGGIVRACSTEG
jgi:hypothetical protein